MVHGNIRLHHIRMFAFKQGWGYNCFLHLLKNPFFVSLGTCVRCNAMMRNFGIDAHELVKTLLKPWVVLTNWKLAPTWKERRHLKDTCLKSTIWATTWKYLLKRMEKKANHHTRDSYEKWEASWFIYYGGSSAVLAFKAILTLKWRPLWEIGFQ